jgi:putative transposase
LARRFLSTYKRKPPEWLRHVTRTRAGKCERLFWQSGGGYDRNIDEPATLLKMIDYLHMNPVRRKLVEQGRDWKWSSAQSYEGFQDDVPISIDPIPSDWLVAT